MKVLVDASVLSHAVRLRRAQQARTVEWGGGTYAWSASVLERKPAERAWLQAQIDAIPRIAAVAQGGSIELFTSPELDFELWEGPLDAMRRTALSLFQGVDLRRAPAPFTYSRLLVSYTDKPGDAKARRKQFLFANLSHPRLKQLSRELGSNKDADAFHILTAERAGLDVFLTDDRRLLNTVARMKGSLGVRVLSPVQLLEVLASAV